MVSIIPRAVGEKPFCCTMSTWLASDPLDFTLASSFSPPMWLFESSIRISSTSLPRHYPAMASTIWSSSSCSSSSSSTISLILSRMSFVLPAKSVCTSSRLQIGLLHYGHWPSINISKTYRNRIIILYCWFKVSSMLTWTLAISLVITSKF